MRVRPAVRADIPAVVRLRSRAFRHSSQPTPAAAEAYFAKVLFDHPWRDAALPSLVCEDDSGGIQGFLGLITRPMTAGGRRVRMGVPTQLMADPDAGGMVGIRLLKTVFAGHQDLLFSDAANEAARRLWEGLGGVTNHLLSIRWTLPLRPVAAAAARLGDQPVWRALRFGLRPATTLADAVARRRLSGALERPALQLAPLSPPAAAAAWSRMAARRPLAPHYDAAGLAWLLERVAERAGPAGLTARAVMDGGELVGWFVGCLEGRRFELLQLAAPPGRAGDVLAAARQEAMRSPAQLMSCRYDAAQAAEWAAGGGRLEREGPWALVHAADKALERAALLGDAFLSRLEGETWLNF